MSRSPAARPNLVVLVLALGGIVVSLMQTLVIPLIPRLPALLHASAAEGAFRLIMALGCGTALAALAIAAFIPGASVRPRAETVPAMAAGRS